MRRRVRCLLGLAVWALTISVAYLVIAMVDDPLAESLVAAFVVLLLVPATAVEIKEHSNDHG